MLNTTLHHDNFRGDRGSDTLNCRQERTIDEFLQDKGTKPVNNKKLPDGVVRIGDLIQDFLKQHNKKEL